MLFHKDLHVNISTEASVGTGNVQQQVNTVRDVLLLSFLEVISKKMFDW